MSAESTTLYDFTDALTRYYGDDAADLGSGVYGMYAGDTNNSELVNATDYLLIKPLIGNPGYYNPDCNLSGMVNATDYLVIKPNIGEESQVP